MFKSIFILTIIFMSLEIYATDICVNGGFESSDSDMPRGWATGWFTVKSKTSEWEYNNDSETGNHFLSLSDSENDSANIFWKQKDLIIIPGNSKYLDISINMKFIGEPRYGLTGGYARVYVSWLNEKGEKIKGEEIFSCTDQENNSYKKLLEIPADAKKMDVLLGLLGKGTAAFDALSIIPVTDIKTHDVQRASDIEIEKLNKKISLLDFREQDVFRTLLELTKYDVNMVNSIQKKDLSKKFKDKEIININDYLVLINKNAVLILSLMNNLQLCSLRCVFETHSTEFLLPTARKEPLWRMTRNNAEITPDDFSFKGTSIRNSSSVLSWIKNDETGIYGI